MATFLTSLWESVFTPGTTPTLLVATNVSFAALQLVLFALLVATYSYHFLALSLISGGLWWAINWFALELTRAEGIEKEADRIRRRRTGEMDGGRAEEKDKEGSGVEGGSEGDDLEEDTETETERATASGRAPAQQEGVVRVRGGPGKAAAVLQSAGQQGAASGGGDAAASGPGSQDTAPQLTGPRIRGGPQKILGVMRSAEQARQGGDGWQGDDVSGSGHLVPEGSDRADLSSSSMTDSEWEKVSEGGREL